jgi:hypothetical protein
MAIPYATADRARAVNDDLKRVAAKLKRREQLHLPAFLDVPADAPFSEWDSQFKKMKSKFINTGPDVAAQLCGSLEPEFKEEPTWRGLLNALGKAHVDEEVKLMADSCQGPEVLLPFFKACVLKVRFFVGSPDADAVVQDVFTERRLEVPVEEPNGRPDPEPDLEPERDKEPSNKSGSVPFWRQVVGSVFRKIAENAPSIIDRIAQNAPTIIDRMARNKPVDVRGTWKGRAAILSIAQRGAHIEVQGAVQNQSFAGQGTVRGRTVEMDVFLMPVGEQLHVILEVSPNGAGMTGTASDGSGRSTPVQLWK